jgi:hypothetical protein
MEPSFRPATDADADPLLAMMREYYTYDGHAFDESLARVALLTFLRERPSVALGWCVSRRRRSDMSC